MKQLLLLLLIVQTAAISASPYAKCDLKKVNYELTYQEEIRIHVDNDKVIKVYDEEVNIENISEVINEKLRRYDNEVALSMNVSIIVDAIVSEDFINLIKEEIKKTPIRLVNLQRNIIENYSPNGQLTQKLINQYNSLIQNWNQLDDSQRYYRQIELDFVESVNQRMNLRQKLEAERLPGYLPFVAKPEPKTEISQQLIEKWSNSSNVRLFLNEVNISQSEFNTLNHDEIKSYYLIKLIENEEKIQEVYLQL